MDRNGGRLASSGRGWKDRAAGAEETPPVLGRRLLRTAVRPPSGSSGRLPSNRVWACGPEGTGAQDQSSCTQSRGPSWVQGGTRHVPLSLDHEGDNNPLERAGRTEGLVPGTGALLGPAEDRPTCPGAGARTGQEAHPALPGPFGSHAAAFGGESLCPPRAAWSSWRISTK